MKNVRWLPHLDLYTEHAALEFTSKSERDRALQALWRDKELCGMPRNYANALTMIVPKIAVTIFKQKRIKFQVHAVEQSKPLRKAS
jgi:hypothetical protein